jgi:hypothetical protein
MVYAAVYKRTLTKKDNYKNKKLQKQLGRKLLPEEIIYRQFEYFRYISILSLKTSRPSIRLGAYKYEAILYLEEDLPYVRHVLKGKDYHIIDANTNTAILRKPAAINIALQPETIGDVKINA